MITVLIIEDERPARQRLKRLLADVSTPVKIAAELDTVADSIAFLQQHQPDLIFSDIELLDGQAFDIYRQQAPGCPIIFTTAYHQFWMDAFESNGIDYLLKPFSTERFQKAWDKFQLLRNQPSSMQPLASLLQRLESTLQTKAYKQRFSIHGHQHIYFLDTTQIVWLEARDGVVLAFDTAGKKHLLSHDSLSSIAAQLDPTDFFRIHRSCVIRRQHIERIERLNKNALSVKMKGYPDYHAAAQTITAAFRQWLEG